MTSEAASAYVWVWLPGADDPVVAGVLDSDAAITIFTYGRSYLERAEAIPLYTPELPLGPGRIQPVTGAVASCISDAAPDAWGRRVIDVQHLDRETDLGILDYLLESGSDRIGALDFQRSAREYVARGMEHATLDELAESAQRVEQGVPLSPELDAALINGSAIGGARPKALLRDGDRQLIAKFSSTSDVTPVVKAEFVAMTLARRAGIDVATVALTKTLGKDVLLVDRFDRPDRGGRTAMVTALTVLGLSENEALFGGASYAALADRVRQRFAKPDATLREIFSRITFNVLVGNNDDHPRNHAAFWDGEQLNLTPAYDICPQPRAGGETRQLMAIGPDGSRMSQLIVCVNASTTYHLEPREARSIIDHQLDVIRAGWGDVCDDAGLSEVERAALWERQFLNPYAFQDY